MERLRKNGQKKPPGWRAGSLAQLVAVLKDLESAGVIRAVHNLQNLTGLTYVELDGITRILSGASQPHPSLNPAAVFV